METITPETYIYIITMTYWGYYARETDNPAWHEARQWAIKLMLTWVKEGDELPKVLADLMKVINQ